MILEDGTGVEDANTYLTLVEVRAFALDRGVELSADDDILSAQLVQASDWLETMADQYVGKPTYGVATDDHPAVQGMAWPRTVPGCCASDYPEDLGVPKQVKKAQAFCVMAIHDGLVLVPTPSEDDRIKRDKTDVLETEFFAPVSTELARPEAAYNQLKTLLRSYVPPGGFMTVRV